MSDDLTDCQRYVAAYGLDPMKLDCCSSCHSEWEGGYSEPLDELGPDGTEYGVCCGAARYVTTDGAKSHD